MIQENKVDHQMADLGRRLETSQTHEKDGYAVQTALGTERRLTAALASTLSELRAADGAEQPYALPWLNILREEMANGNSAKERRIVLLGLGASRLSAPILSVLFGGVDLIEIDSHSDGWSVALRRYVDGAVVDQESESYPDWGLELLVAGVALFVEGGSARGVGPVDAAVVVGAESNGTMADAIVDVLGVPYVLIALDPVYSASRLRLEAGASACYLTSDEQLSDWDGSHIFPASSIDPHDVFEMTDAIGRALSTESLATLSSAPAPDRPANRKALLVSYYSPPCTAVSVQRLDYWFNQIPGLARANGHDMDVSWLTAAAQSRSLEGMIYVPDHGPLRLSDAEWQEINELRALDLDIQAASWSHYVRQAMVRRPETYDTVVMSGNPFYYFSLAPFFREIWGSKIILDFRDPFARSTRFRYSVEQRARLIEMEDRMVAEADAIISVNEECLGSVAPGVDAERRVVSNGFDETMFDTVASDHASRRGDVVHLGYAGTAFANLPLDELLDSLPAARYRFFHFGRDYSASQAARHHAVSAAPGLLPYPDLVARLKSLDAGVIMTSGESSTQTTKLFDYLACDLDIIIVTKGVVRTGGLHDLTKDLPGVHWVRNDPTEMREFFRTFQPTRPKRGNRLRFSRRHQTRLLVDLIFELRDTNDG